MSAPKPAAESFHNVLVIEDERKMATVLSRALGIAGFNVTAVGTGMRGLEVLDEDAFELAILDLLLPDVDGVSVLAQARRRAPEMPVMVLSALTDVRSKVVCLELGACDYVAKPCELPELMARVRLRTRPPGGQARRHRLQRGSYVLDLQRRVVTNARGDVPLTTREFVLLEYLMDRADETCTRDELLEHVWGYTFDPGTNVVDVCVGRLRHKLGGHCLVTVRNVGYCFVDA